MSWKDAVEAAAWCNKELEADQSAHQAHASVLRLVVTWCACGRAAGPVQIPTGASSPPLPPRMLHGAASEPHVCYAAIAPRLRHGVHCQEFAVKRGALGPRHEAQLSVWVVRRSQPPCLTCLAICHAGVPFWAHALMERAPGHG